MIKIKNPIQLNDWSIKSLLYILLSFQLSLWGFISLDLIGIHIPILRQIISHIYLTFLPGVLILKLLKLHKLGTTETLLYTTGLSLSTLMFTGFSMNLIYPYFGISEPISCIPLMVTLTIVISILFFLAYIRDKEYSNPDYFDLKEILSPKLLILLLVPFLSIFGTYLVNYYDNNILLMFMIVIISFLIVLQNYIPPKIYPLVIWVISISLIYHTTLISDYLNVNDILGEYKIAHSVIQNSYWDWTFNHNYNSVLSITILAPIFYYIYNIDLTYVFKIIYPLLFSITSLGTYLIFNNITHNKKVSFMSSILFIIIVPFFYEVPLICKQCIGEIFLILLLLFTFNLNLKSVTRSFLVIISSMSLIVSHYGISYIIMFSLIFIFCCEFVAKNETTNKMLQNICIKLNRDKSLLSSSKIKNTFSLNFVIFFLTFTFGWYIYISDSSSFNSITYLGNQISRTLIEDFANPEHSRGLHMIIKNEFSLTHYITKLFYLTSQFFILIGFLNTLKNLKKDKFDTIYLFYSFYFLTILFAAIVISGFSIMDPRRLYHLSLFTLAPFSIIGGLILCKYLYDLSSNRSDDKYLVYSFNFVAVYLALFVLFSTGFIYEVTNDYPTSVSLSQKSISQFNDTNIKADLYESQITDQEIFCGKWLAKNMIDDGKVYRGDFVGDYTSLSSYNNIDPKNVIGFSNTTQSIGAGYIQISYLNLLGIGSTWSNTLQRRSTYKFSDVHFLLKNTEEIYDNGNSEILWKNNI